MGYNGLRGEYYFCAWFFNLGLQQEPTDGHVVGTGMAAILDPSWATQGPLHMPWTGCMGGHALAKGRRCCLLGLVTGSMELWVGRIRAEDDRQIYSVYTLFRTYAAAVLDGDGDLRALPHLSTLISVTEPHVCIKPFQQQSGGRAVLRDGQRLVLLACALCSENGNNCRPGRSYRDGFWPGWAGIGKPSPV